MALEQVIKCPRTLNKFRDGSLGGLMDGFCDALLEDGFTASTVRRHLSNISHLNAHLGTRKNVDEQALSAQEISKFLKDYPAKTLNRGALDKQVACVKLFNLLIFFEQFGFFFCNHFA